MTKKIQIGILLGMILLGKNVVGQTDQTSGKVFKPRATVTYVDLLLNVLSTNLNYGESNSAFSGYKKSTFGAQVGASFQGGITPNFSVVSELYFIMKGGVLNANNPLNASKTTLRFYNLELPLLARFHIGDFYLNGGPSLAYSLYGSKKSEGRSTDLSFGRSTEGFRRFDGGVQAGAGYRFRVKQRSITLDVRYTYGLTNISRGQEMYNRYLNISLHFSKPWKTNPLERKKNS